MQKKKKEKNTPRNNLVQTLYFVVDKIIRSFQRVLSLLGKHGHSHGLSDIQETKTKIILCSFGNRYLFSEEVFWPGNLIYGNYFFKVL